MGDLSAKRAVRPRVVADAPVDYRALGEFRYQIRRFLHFSEEAARAAGIEPQQHQLLLAIKGLPAGSQPSVGTLAERLQIQHHSAVELVNRLEKLGFVERHRGEHDRREVLVQLTSRGERILRELSLFHQEELRNSGPALSVALRRLMTRGPGKAAKATQTRKTGSK